MLQNRTITLLDPITWDDSNDIFYLEEFKRRKKLKSVLALCLSSAGESYHYWKVFAGHPSGVCIRFHQAPLIRALSRTRGLTIAALDYREMTAARKRILTVDDFPFVKRTAYKDEREVRALWQSATDERSTLEVPFPLRCIDRVTLSPWLPKPLVDATKVMLRSIEGCSRLEVVRSTIVASEEWKNIARRVA